MKQWFNSQAIFVLWLREMKRYLRAKSRIVGSLGMPFFFLIFLGTGFQKFRPYSGPEGVNYLNFLAPGILALVLQLGAMFTGIAILWDRQFGFLKEIMVAPVSRVAIVLGRTIGGMTTAFFQGTLFIVVAYIAGLRIQDNTAFISVPVFMLLISCAFVNLGLTISSFMRDMQGFSIVMNFVMVPIFLLSGALFPVKEFPGWVQALSFGDPLFYGVDGLRACMTGISVFSPWFDFLVLLAFCLLMVLLGAFLFSRVDID